MVTTSWQFDGIEIHFDVSEVGQHLLGCYMVVMVVINVVVVHTKYFVVRLYGVGCENMVLSLVIVVRSYRVSYAE